MNIAVMTQIDSDIHDVDCKSGSIFPYATGFRPESGWESIYERLFHLSEFLRVDDEGVWMVEGNKVQAREKHRHRCDI